MNPEQIQLLKKLDRAGLSLVLTNDPYKPVDKRTMEVWQRAWDACIASGLTEQDLKKRAFK
jgi:hypothetical protein